MPKVSKVGKFRKTAAASAAAASSSKISDVVKKQKRADGSMDTDDKPRRKVERSKSFTQIMQSSTATAGNVAPTSTSTATKEATTANDAAVTAQNEKETALSRGQKRRQAKRDQYLKREQMILSSLKLKKEEDQKKRIDGMDALKEALLEAVRDKKEEKQTKVPAAQYTTNKAKRSLVASELHHMGLVLQHPDFQKNPFEAIQEHLRNTLIAGGEAQEAEGQIKRKQDAEAKQQRKEERKERQRDMKGGRKKKQRTKFKAARSRKSR
jgi:Ribosome biogenesis protein SLX9